MSSVKCLACLTKPFAFSGATKKLQALPRCNYPTWSLNRLQTKLNHKLSTIQPHNWLNRHPTNNNNNTGNHNIYLVVPYTKGLTESLNNMCNEVGVEVCFKGNNTIQNFLVASKDKNTITQNSDLIYRF